MSVERLEGTRTTPPDTPRNPLSTLNGVSRGHPGDLSDLTGPTVRETYILRPFHTPFYFGTRFNLFAGR